MCDVMGMFKIDGIPINLGVVGVNILRGGQNRGKEAAGMSIGNENKIKTFKDFGTVSEVFDKNWLTETNGITLVGQTRYSTAGKKVSKQKRAENVDPNSEHGRLRTRDVQPLYSNTMSHGDFALVHNGTLTNAKTLKKEMKANHGIQFNSSLDSEVILLLIRYYIEVERLSIIDSIKSTMLRIEGTFACILSIDKKLFAFKDKYSNRPLKISKTNEYYILSSEDNVWNHIKAKYLMKVEPAQIVEIGVEGITVHDTGVEPIFQICAVENIYMKKPESTLKSLTNESAGYKTTGGFRKKAGILLYEDHPLPAGIVFPIMDSGLYFAQGYQFAHLCANPGGSFWGIPLLKDQIVGRAFQEPSKKDRKKTLDVKFFELFDTISDELELLHERFNEVQIICVDDSLIRGDTSKKIIVFIKKLLKKYYPKIYPYMKFSFLVGSPQYRNPCFYGIDTPKRKKLIASKYSKENAEKEIAEFLDADYVGYLSELNLQKALGPKCKNFCTACFTGKYVIPIIDPNLIRKRDADLIFQ